MPRPTAHQISALTRALEREQGEFYARNALRSNRKRLGLSLAQVATPLGIHPYALSRIEGQASPRPINVIAIQSVLDNFARDRSVLDDEAITRVLNLTDAPITITHDDDAMGASVETTFPPSGTVATVEVEQVGTLIDMPVYKHVVYDLPAPERGTVFIVSPSVHAAARLEGRADVFKVENGCLVF